VPELLTAIAAASSNSSRRVIVLTSHSPMNVRPILATNGIKYFHAVPLPIVRNSSKPSAMKDYRPLAENQMLHRRGMIRGTPIIGNP
jgi:hypothetical protein